MRTYTGKLVNTLILLGILLILPHVKSKDGCVDRLVNCDDFSNTTCKEYPHWSKINCAKTCRMCKGMDTALAASASPPPPTTQTTASTTQTTASTTQTAASTTKKSAEVCKDLTDVCAKHLSVCTNNLDYGKVYCRKKCGLCRPCREGWHYYEPEGMCIKGFGPYDSRQHTSWSMAKGVCQVWGGDLVVIRDEKKQDFVLELFAPYFQYWVGIRNNGTGLVYVDGSSLGSFHPWSTGADDRMNKVTGQCVTLDTKTETWNGVHCDRRLPFVCSTPPLEELLYP